SVWRPRGREVFAGALAAGRAESGLAHEGRAREQVARLAVPVQRNHEQVALRVVEPLVPAADGEGVGDAEFRFRVLAFGRDLLVRLRVRRAGVDGPLIEDGFPVRAPARGARG